MEFLIFLCLLALFYIYFGYQLLLSLFALVSRKKVSYVPATSYPRITVLVTVFNEAEQILDKIKNVLACDYPKEKLEILVASDGSNDGTDDLVKGFDHPSVLLFRPQDRKGKTDTQNQAIKIATGDIIIFTDADTRFSEKFLREIVFPFSSAAIGGVDGHLLFRRVSGNEISESQSLYWMQELKIRKLESELGILAVASGACMAVRKELIGTMAVEVGEDCQLPLEVVSKGYKMVHVDEAIAWDEMPSSPKGEFRTRVRMTQRNWQGTWLYPELLNPLKNPGYAWALWSHKILRWLSPFFFFPWILMSLALVSKGGYNLWVAMPGIVFFIYAVGGAILKKFGRQVPGSGFLWSFIVANCGFMVGVLKGITGNRIVTYR